MKKVIGWENAAIPSSHPLSNKAYRLAWNIVYLIFFRPSPKFFYGWRRLLLRLFGATVGRGAVVHGSVRIWSPQNLILGDFSAIGPDVDLYSVSNISIGSYSVISQRAFICTATHDYRYIDLPLTSRPISIGQYVWICAEVFVSPGVAVGDKAIVLARSVVTTDVESLAIACGHPAQKVRIRNLIN